MKPGDAEFANAALAHQLEGVPTAEITNRVGCEGRSSQNWKQGRTGPQWHQVAKMLADPMLGPLVLKAAATVAEANALEKPHRPDAGTPAQESTDHG